MAVVTWAQIPVISAECADPGTLGYIQQGYHPLFRTLYPGESPSAEQRRMQALRAPTIYDSPGVIHWRTERVPVLGCATLRGVVARWDDLGLAQTDALLVRYADGPASGEFPRDPDGDGTPEPWLERINPNFASWRELQTDLTDQVWLKATNATADEGSGYMEIRGGYLLQPGVLLRMLLYSPPPGQRQPSYVAVAFRAVADPEQPAAERPAFTLYLPRQAHGDGSELSGLGTPTYGAYPQRPALVLDRNAWPTFNFGVLTPSGTDPVYGFAEFVLDECESLSFPTRTLLEYRVRLLEGCLVVQERRGSNAWVVPLPRRWRRLGAVQARLYAAGGQAAFHLQQLTYAAPGACYEARPAVTPGFVTDPGEDHPVIVHARCPKGTSVTGHQLNPHPDDEPANWRIGATLSTANSYVSPILYAVSEHRAATLAYAPDVPSDLTGIRAVDIRLNELGRGQTCELTFADKAGIPDSPPWRDNSVITVRGHWSGDSAHDYDLFRGFVRGPVRFERGEGDDRAYPRLTVSDETARWQGKYALPLTGTFAGLPLGTAAAILANAAGLDSSRYEFPAVTPTLAARDPRRLQFSPDTDLARMLDACCAAVEWEWWVDYYGVLRIGPREACPAPTLTLADSNATVLSVVREVSSERLQGGPAVNHVAVLSRLEQGTVMVVKADADAAYNEGSAEFVGDDIWAVDIGEYDEPRERARRRWNEAREEALCAEFEMFLDFAAPVRPRQTVLTGTLAGSGLPSGLTMWVTDVTQTVDMGVNPPQATVRFRARQVVTDA